MNGKYSAIEGSLFIPLAELPHKLSTLDPTKEYVVVCKVGQRSLSALELCSLPVLRLTI
jgi:rhodanese-related sulfurtransferase